MACRVWLALLAGTQHSTSLWTQPGLGVRASRSLFSRTFSDGGVGGRAGDLVHHVLTDLQTFTHVYSNGWGRLDGRVMCLEARVPRQIE